MPTYIISTAQSSQSLGFNDNVYVTRQGSLINSSGNGIVTLDMDYQIEALIEGEVAGLITAIRLGGTSAGSFDANGISNNIVTIGATGSVGALGSTSFGISFYGSGNTLINHGSLTAGSTAMRVTGPSSQITNTGLISGAEYGVSINSTTGTSITDISNSGTILGNNEAGISVNHDGLNLLNTGLISGDRGVFHVGVSFFERLWLTNSGTIDGTGAYAVEVQSAADTYDEVLNSGLIDGGIGLASGNDRIVNTGMIDGQVNLGPGNDIFEGLGGTTTQEINGGTGDDTFHIDQSTAVVDGGADIDTLYVDTDFRQGSNLELIQMLGSGGHTVADDDSATQINGNSGDNLILGAGGNDTLRGRQGDDVLTGGDDDDVIIGNAGNDEIQGDNGADVLFGGTGDDLIAGGYGTDDLFGGAGDDTINPGGAQDRMAGGAGADVFLFETASDAGSGSNADRIDNFQRGLDVIDLVGLGTTPASFIGTSGFSGSGNMEVRYTVNPFGNALVRIDEDGNGTEDARIVVSQTAMLDAGDFLL